MVNLRTYLVVVVWSNWLRYVVSVVCSCWTLGCACLLVVLAPLTRAESKKGTFSRAYSRFDSASAFRAQLFTRSATQDSENTIIDECDDGAF